MSGATSPTTQNDDIYAETHLAARTLWRKQTARWQDTGTTIQNVRDFPMSATPTAGIYLLSRSHGSAVERLAADASFAALVGFAHPPAHGAGAAFVERAESQRTAGKAHWSVVLDRGDVKGISAVLDPYDTQPRILVWIDPAARRNGYGTLAVRLALELAFRSFQRERVRVVAPTGDAAVQRTLAPFGFVAAEVPGVPAGPNETSWDLSRADWVAARDRPALAKLHPDLRAILDAELAAGNTIVETGGGWPDADSVFVRLRDPFRTKPASVPESVVYTEPNDPHWWKADYTSRTPRHTLAC